MKLREYQQRAIDMLYEWMASNNGHPCLVLPTGAGKSHIIAALCKDAVQSWPETRILMVTHQKELIQQNAEKMRQHWKNAPLGIYSASVGSRDFDQITFAGIQSIRNRGAEIGHIDLVIIDEAHSINHKDEGGYRRLLLELEEVNPHLRIIGLTATPYRLGHGIITDKPAIFDALIEPVTVLELIELGYLSRLRSKLTAERLDLTGVHKRGGEYIESELQAAVDDDAINQSVVAESIRLAGDRRSWLFFCAGVNHAHHVCDILQAHGISAECVTGKTPKAEREAILGRFKRGEIRALTNANVLTTGFDAPNTDLIVMLRPTLSPGLYVQMAGRGLRLKDHTDHCLVLDFAGNVERHGPITNVTIPGISGDMDGDAPTKSCPECAELVHASAKVCPSCGYAFPPPAPKSVALTNADILGIEGTDMQVTDWHWVVHTSRTSGKEMLKVTYYGELSDKPVDEYFAVTHEGYAGAKSRGQVASIALNAGVQMSGVDDLASAAALLNRGRCPFMIEHKRDGKFVRVIRRQWGE
jgi:DNA repair protein RadD